MKSKIVVDKKKIKLGVKVVTSKEGKRSVTYSLGGNHVRKLIKDYEGLLRCFFPDEAERLVTKDQVQNGTLIYSDWYNLFQQYSIVMVLLNNKKLLL